MSLKRALALFVILALLVAGAARLAAVRMGRQPDGSFIVATGQRVEAGSLAFVGRPIDMAIRPNDEVFAVLNKSSVFLARRDEVVKGSSAPLGGSAGFRGLAWSPDGKTLYASTDRGHVRSFRHENGTLTPADVIHVAPEGAKGNPVPGGLCVTKDGSRLFVAAANRNAVVEIDLATNEPVREFPVGTLPFEPRLTDDEKTLVVSNWGGRVPKEGDTTARSQDLDVVSDPVGAAASGTVSLVDRADGTTRHVDVGLHPTAIVIAGDRAYVANAMSDSVSEIDLKAGKVTRTIPLRYGSQRLLGSMPNALAVRGETLYVAGGGDNALAEVDLRSGRVRGFRPAGFFPTAVALAADGKTAFVLNTKGNGSVAKTTRGRPGNAHDFQGTVTAVDLTADLDAATARVARNNRWDDRPAVPPLKVYRGAIKHVLYIIKENRTYDEVFGDMPQGNGDPSLCSLGETVMPNHRKLAREFTLFDNGYVSGTNSADGHAWSTQAIANEYLEHFYVGYSRTYPDDGDDPMAISPAGALWDAALKKGRTLRVWGEFCDEKLAKVEPPPKDWFEVWEDRLKGTRRFTFTADTPLPHLRPHLSREVFFWPLWQSDQHRADVVIRDYQRFSREDKVPALMVLSLPCDHGEGTNPKYPTPRAMMADNDLALGRIVEAVSQSPQWKETCILVIEDDAQSGPDHVDGHRTVFLAISPYTKRKAVDSTFYTTTSMIRSIGLMLGLDPLNRFDALADPLAACFTDEPDLTPYRAVPNRVPLDERNPSGKSMTAADRFWLEKTLALDWSHVDAPDPYWLNRINWYSLFKGTREYPSRPGEGPGAVVDED
jgi:YVTN family beta-propeller protein